MMPRRGFFLAAVAGLSVMWAGAPNAVEAKPSPPAYSADNAVAYAKSYLAKRGWTVTRWAVTRGNQELVVEAKRVVGSGKSKRTIVQNFAFKVVVENRRLKASEHPTEWKGSFPN